ncbi:MAG: protein N-lysine methyltransferase family protein [Nitrospirales bacterium]|nr:protein N-lysine methyltransferase family protein [Nitrospirales bacterium]
MPRLGDIQVVVKTKRDIGDETPLEQRDDESLGWAYWDRLWPSELALAEYLIHEHFPGNLTGKHVLEIGCGVGLAGVVAAQLGAFTTFSDMVPVVLEGVKETCRINQIRQFDTHTLDWSSSISMPRKYDIVMGSEVFYDTKNLPGISNVLRSTLKSDGKAFFCDPNRLGLNTIEVHFQEHFAMSVQPCPLNEALRKRSGGGKTGYIYALQARESVSP